MNYSLQHTLIEGVSHQLIATIGDVIAVFFKS